jgi:acyl-CoA dehydrogenase
MTSFRAEVRTQLDRWRAEGVFTPQCDSWLTGYDEDFSRRLGALGWIGLTWTGRTFAERHVLTEELLRAGAPVAGHWIADRQIGPAIARLGSSALKAALLPGIEAGEVRFCLGMSEPDAGSDLAAVRTRARKVDRGWRLDGQKVWSSNAHRATHAYVLARTGDGHQKHEGLTEFVLDVGQPGVTIRRIPDLRGPGHFCEIFLDGAFVPDENVLGVVGDGWRQVTDQLAFERGGPERVLSTYPLLNALLDARPEAGRAGELLARLAALRALGRQVAARMDEGVAPTAAAATLKLLGNRFEVDVIEAARATPGVPRVLLDEALLASPGFSLRGGTTEVLGVVIARSVMSAPAEPLDDVASAAVKVLGAQTDMAGVFAESAEQGWHLLGIPAPEGADGTLADLADVVRAVSAAGLSTPAPELHTAFAGRGWGRFLDPSLPWKHGENLAGEPLDSLDAETPAVPTAWRLLHAARLVGAASGAARRTAAYAATREQFGKPIARFQAVAQLIASAHAAVLLASAALDEALRTPDDDLTAIAALATACRTAGVVARNAHQVHGAIGVTRELGLEKLTRRLWAWRDLETEFALEQRLGAAVLAGAPFGLERLDG